ncbi:fasciclin domain-containing protein [Verrucomicrobiaceae bacterium N1E253]|uniref:Fasciclin domain-containing protein n=1 Tax=Oceaniferula marina TaxID=2748318 RepID=A0A851GLD2_9BACT|nr:fasciclin domain-containing protein [Oceaniferula marina]NWK55560.1 fasciclin domain-containing protein [Oceaniferula marina]
MNTTVKTACVTLFASSFITTASLAGGCGGSGGETAAHKNSAKQSTVMTASSTSNQQNLVSIAAGNKDFSTLVAAAKAAGLVEALSGDGPFTIFAPTNDAFAKLPEGTVESLLKPENKEKLTKILTYHVVPGKVMAADVKAGEAKTLEGSTLDIGVKEGTVTVDKAKVIKTDIVGSNGVIHVIDQVILP